MKRSSLLSTLALMGLAAVMAGSFAAGVRAKSVPCLDGCGKDKKPEAIPGTDRKTCCNPPPCEFMYELNLARTDVQAAEIGQAEFNLMNPTGGGTAQQYFDSVREASDKLLATNARCPTNKFYRPSFPFFVDVKTCKIEGNLQDRLDKSNACEEVVKADYHAAEIGAALCTPNQQDKDFSFDDFMANQRIKDEARVNSLEQQIVQYWNSCKAFRDVKVRDAVADAGVDALKDQFLPKPPPKPAKRNLGSGRSGRGK